MSNCARCGAVWSEEHQRECEAQSEAKAAKLWAKLPKKKWDGEGMIYSETYDEYFWDEESAAEWLLYHELTSWDDMRLVICKPTYAHPLTSDSWEDELPNDGEDVPGWLEDAVDAFNKAIEGQPPLSWEPGKVAVDTSDWEIPKEDDDA